MDASSKRFFYFLRNDNWCFICWSVPLLPLVLQAKYFGDNEWIYTIITMIAQAAFLFAILRAGYMVYEGQYKKERKKAQKEQNLK